MMKDTTQFHSPRHAISQSPVSKPSIQLGERIIHCNEWETQDLTSMRALLHHSTQTQKDILFVIIIGTIPRYKISLSPVTTFDEPVKIISNIYTSGDWRLANRQNIQSKYKSQKLLDGLMSGSDEVPHTQRINFWLSKMDMSPVDPINTAGELWVGKTAQSNCYPSGDQTIILNHVCCIKMKFVFWREWTDVLPIK